MEKNPSSDSSSHTNPNPNMTTSDNEDLERPDWLPAGWIMKPVTRTSGLGAGRTDKYYKSPNSKQWLRSVNNVLSFLEIPSKESISDEVPLKVKWTMPDMCKPSWVAEVDGEMVPESTLTKWADVYTYKALETKNDEGIDEDNA